MVLPETIQARLSGLGDIPNFGRNSTVASIQNAIQQAERGEVYLLFGLFRDMIENFPHLQAEMGKRIMSFMGQTETFEPFDKNNADDVLAAKVIQEMVDNCDNWREGSLHLANGHVWPISGAEKIYEPIDSSNSSNFKYPVRYRLKKLHPIPYALYTYKVAYWNISNMGGNPNGGLAPNAVMDNSGSVPIQQVQGSTALNGAYSRQNINPALIWNPDDWHPDLRFYNTYENGLIDWTMTNCYKPDPIRHVLHSANVSTVGMRENFGGLLRSLLPYWLYSKSGMDWFARAMERYGSPFAVAYANTSNKNIFDLLTKAFNQATKVNALILPPQAKLDLKEVMVSGMADGYAKFIEICNTEVTKAVLGQTLSTSSKGSGMMGGSGVADLHSDVKEEWALFDKRSYCEMQRKQIFDPYLKINGYKGKCRSVRGGVNPSQQALMSKTLQSLYLSGIRVPESEEQVLTNTFGIRLEVFDPQAQIGDKINKSAKDHANPAKN